MRFFPLIRLATLPTKADEVSIPPAYPSDIGTSPW